MQQPKLSSVSRIGPRWWWWSHPQRRFEDVRRPLAGGSVAVTVGVRHGWRRVQQQEAR